MKLYFCPAMVGLSGNLEGRFQGASGDSPSYQSPLTLPKTTGSTSQGNSF